VNTRPRPCTGFRFAFRQASLSSKEAVKNDFATWIADIADNEALFKKHVYDNDDLDQMDLWEHRARLYRLLAIGDHLKIEFIRVSALLDKADDLKSHIGLIEQQHKELFTVLLAWHAPLELQKDIPESFKTAAAIGLSPS